MLKTNIEWAENDIMDIVRIFSENENLDIDIVAVLDEFIDKNILNAQIKFLDKTYIFSYELEKNLSELLYKRYVKRFVKLSLYKVLKEFYNIDLPWGSLTGIRPVKLSYQLESEGHNFEDYFLNELLVSKESVESVKRIREVQKKYYQKDDDNADFFVGIPFCPTKCLYCSFVSLEIDKTKQYLNDYVNVLVSEIKRAKPLIKNLRSVYIGGGTPVSIPLDLLEKILQAIGQVTCEYSVEAGRPDCITREALELFKKYNVTRICVNPQTFLDKTLKIIGRRHTANDIIEKFNLARSYNLDINMDLIAGLPEETFEDFKRSIDITIGLKPENITIHTLSLKNGSYLKENCTHLSEGEVGEMLKYSRETLYNSGYNPYYMYRQKYMAGNFENTGYSLQGKECVYNIDIMEEITQNIACGANAVSKRVYNKQNRIERYKNCKDIKTYIEKIDEICESKNKLFN